MAHTISNFSSIPLLGKVIICLTTVRLGKVEGVVFGKNDQAFSRLLVRYADGSEDTIDASQAVEANRELVSHFKHQCALRF